MQLATPTITTIIPTFQRPQLLRRAIRSVQLQTYRDLRICIYDNASDDETPALVAQLAREDPRIVYHCHERNIGPVANSNYGLREVQTPYYSLLADDDLLLPNLYADAIDALSKYPTAAFACSPTVMFNQQGGYLQHRNRSWGAGFYTVEVENVLHMMADHFISTGVVFRQTARETVGAFEESGSDHSYLARAAGLHPFVVNKREGAMLMIHPASFSSGGVQSVISRDGKRVSAGNTYLKSWLFSYTAGMLSLPTLSAEDKVQVFNYLAGFIRTTAINWSFLKAIPANDPDQLDDLRMLLRQLRVLPGMQLGLAALARLMRRNPRAAARLAIGMRALINHRTRVKQRRSQLSSQDRHLLAYIQALESDQYDPGRLALSNDSMNS